MRCFVKQKHCHMTINIITSLLLTLSKETLWRWAARACSEPETGLGWLLQSLWAPSALGVSPSGTTCMSLSSTRRARASVAWRFTPRQWAGMSFIPRRRDRRPSGSCTMSRLPSGSMRKRKSWRRISFRFVGIMNLNSQIVVVTCIYVNVVIWCTFQVVFEGIHGSSRANGFVGIDDIAYFEGDCTSKKRSHLFG